MLAGNKNSPETDYVANKKDTKNILSDFFTSTLSSKNRFDGFLHPTTIANRTAPVTALRAMPGAPLKNPDPLAKVGVRRLSPAPPTGVGGISGGD